MHAFNLEFRALRISLRRSHFPAVCIPEAQTHRNSAFSGKEHGEFAVAKRLIRKISSHPKVFDSLLVPCVKIAIASYTAEAEKVLTFKIRAVTPTKNLKRKMILLAWFYVFGNIKLSFQLAILTIADKFAVDPQIDIGSDGAEMRYDIFSCPVIRNHERTPVGPGMIVFDRHVRRIVTKLVLPRIAHIDISRVTVSVKLPYTRNRHLRPIAVIEIRLLKIHRTSI